VNTRLRSNPTVDIGAVEVLLCDADGNLFDSERPAFVASAGVTNELLAELGSHRRYTAAELRRRALGKNFRNTAVELAAEERLALDPPILERWVLEERRRVVNHLRATLDRDAVVSDALHSLRRRFRLAVVTSSAMDRLTASLVAAQLDGVFPPSSRFSAENSLPVPTSKPDPAIYVFAGQQLRVTQATALAIEDSVTGVTSAIAAGFPTVGNLHYVSPDDRRKARAELLHAGAAFVVGSWPQLVDLLMPSRLR